MDASEIARRVKGIWGFIALSTLGAIISVGSGHPVVAVAFLALAVASMVFAAVTGDHGNEDVADAHPVPVAVSPPAATIPVGAVAFAGGHASSARLVG